MNGNESAYQTFIKSWSVCTSHPSYSWIHGYIMLITHWCFMMRASHHNVRSFWIMFDSKSWDSCNVASLHGWTQNRDHNWTKTVWKDLHVINLLHETFCINLEGMSATMPTVNMHYEVAFWWIYFKTKDEQDAWQNFVNFIINVLVMMKIWYFWKCDFISFAYMM